MGLRSVRHPESLAHAIISRLAVGAATFARAIDGLFVGATNDRFQNRKPTPLAAMRAQIRAQIMGIILDFANVR